MKGLLIAILPLSFTLTAFGQDYPDSGFTNKAEAKNLKVHSKKEGKWYERMNEAEEVTKDTNWPFYHLIIYKDDKPFGVVREYFKNKLWRVIPYKNGVMNGVRKEYYESGVLRSEELISDGKENGLEKWYYENGKLEGETLWSNDKMLSSKRYDENGNEIK